MRLLVLFALASAFTPAAFAQQAAPQPTIVFAATPDADAAPVARQTATRLGTEAEQYRLNALAHLGLGNPEAARRAVEKLVATVPGYTPQPNDPAPFVQLVVQANGRAGRSLQPVERIAGN